MAPSFARYFITGGGCFCQGSLQAEPGGVGQTLGRLWRRGKHTEGVLFTPRHPLGTFIGSAFLSTPKPLSLLFPQPFLLVAFTTPGHGAVVRETQCPDKPTLRGHSERLAGWKKSAMPSSEWEREGRLSHRACSCHAGRIECLLWGPAPPWALSFLWGLLETSPSQSHLCLPWLLLHSGH